jgi:hypothetical protein
LQTFAGKYQKLSLSGIGLEENAKAAKIVINEYQLHATKYLAAAYLRGYAAQVRTALPISRSLALDRVNQVLGDLKACEENMTNFKGVVKGRLAEVRGCFSKKNTDLVHRVMLDKHLEKTLQESESMCDEIVAKLDVVADRLQREVEDRKSALVLGISVDATGTVSKVKRLPDDGTYFPKK